MPLARTLAPYWKVLVIMVSSLPASIRARQEGARPRHERLQVQGLEHGVGGRHGGRDHRLARQGITPRNARERRHLYAGGQHYGVDLAGTHRRHAVRQAGRVVTSHIETLWDLTPPPTH